MTAGNRRREREADFQTEIDVRRGEDGGDENAEDETANCELT
jgi:hypothetical protein